MMSAMETSLTWLARFAHSAHDQDWRRLDELYGPLIDGWLSRAGVADSDRDDVKQEVFIVVSRRIPSFQHRHPGAFRGWLRSILQNEIKKYFSVHRQRRCTLSIDDLVIDDSRLARLHDYEHDVYIAKQAMRIVQLDFSKDTWIAFERQVLEGFSPKETAIQLGISINAALKAKSRVLKRIRFELSNLLEEH